MRIQFAIFLIIVRASLAQYQPRVIWDRSGETDSSAYGVKILPLGDQNDDGFADWAVMADGNVASWHGTHIPKFEFFRGGAAMPTEPYFVFRQDSNTYDQAWSASLVGDITGDGYADWFTTYWPHGFPPYRIYGFFYGGHDTSSVPDFEWTQSVVTGFYSLQDFDFNGDGVDDLFGTNNETGTARIYYGGSPLDTFPDWTLYQPPPGLNQTYPSAVGDFNGDGASDFICYNPNPPFNLAVFLGGANPDTVPAYMWSDMMMPIGGVKSINGDAADEFLLGLDVHFGRTVLAPVPDTQLSSGAGSITFSAGDINRDGYQDLILLSQQCFPNHFGCMTLHLGHPWIYPEPTLEIEGWSEPFNLIGIYTAAALGDVNGDSVDDFAVGAWTDWSWTDWRGRCVIFAGDDTLEADANDAPPSVVGELSVSVYPNPFNGLATVELDIPTGVGNIALTTYNLLGQEVATDQVDVHPGEMRYAYNANDLSSGLYLLRIEAGSYQSTQKLMLIR